MSHALTIAAGHSSTWLEKLGEHGLPLDGRPREVHIRLAPDSRLTHYRLLGPAGPSELADRLTVEIGAGACYEQRMLAAPAGQFRSEQTIRLHGRGASATLGAACVALPQTSSISTSGDPRRRRHGERAAHQRAGRRSRQGDAHRWRPRFRRAGTASVPISCCERCSPTAKPSSRCARA